MKKKANSTSKAKNPYWKSYTSIKKQIEQANKILTKDLKCKNIDWKKVQKNSSQLILLLGECNYFALECKHCKEKGKWS